MTTPVILITIITVISVGETGTTANEDSDASSFFSIAVVDERRYLSNYSAENCKYIKISLEPGFLDSLFPTFCTSEILDWIALCKVPDFKTWAI